MNSNRCVCLEIRRYADKNKGGAIMIRKLTALVLVVALALMLGVVAMTEDDNPDNENGMNFQDMKQFGPILR